MQHYLDGYKHIRRTGPVDLHPDDAILDTQKQYLQAYSFGRDKAPIGTNLSAYYVNNEYNARKEPRPQDRVEPWQLNGTGLEFAHIESTKDRYISYNDMPPDELASTVKNTLMHSTYPKNPINSRIILKKNVPYV